MSGECKHNHHLKVGDKMENITRKGNAAICNSCGKIVATFMYQANFRQYWRERPTDIRERPGRTGPGRTPPGPDRAGGRPTLDTTPTTRLHWTQFPAGEKNE